jgi:transcriptional regulator with XRE-family HTH domain
MTNVAKNLKLIRLVARKTQSGFGQLFDATKSMMSSYEGGRALPDVVFISRVAKYAGISEEDLKTKVLKEDDLKIKGKPKTADKDYLNERDEILKELSFREALAHRDVKVKTNGKVPLASIEMQIAKMKEMIKALTLEVIWLRSVVLDISHQQATDQVLENTRRAEEKAERDLREQHERNA